MGSLFTASRETPVFSLHDNKPNRNAKTCHSGMNGRNRMRAKSPLQESGSATRLVIMKNDLLLHEAVIKNDPEAVSAVLAEPCDVNSRNNYGRAPIHWAASRGSVDIIRLLINAKCDIEARDKFGMRPLLMAAWHGHEGAVRELIEAGACVAATNKNQQDLITCAAHSGRAPLLDHLLSTLHNVDVDTIDVAGETPLVHAARAGHVAVLRLLLDAGADVERASNLGIRPLHAACAAGAAEAALELVAHGASRRVRDAAGDTPLLAAAAAQRTELVRALLEAGCPPDDTNHKGFTALHVACTLGSRGIVDLLLKHGANINLQTMAGDTPLHLACRNDAVEIMEQLIAHGADVNCYNQASQTAVQVAGRAGAALLGGPPPALRAAARGSFSAIVDIIIATTKLDDPVEVFDEAADVEKQETPQMKQKAAVSKDDASKNNPDILKDILWKLAYRQFGVGDWKRLALFWNFSDEQILAIERQYSGTASYKEHGYRLLTMWRQSLPNNADAMALLSAALNRIGKKNVADLIARNYAQEVALNKSSTILCHCVNCSIT